MDALVSGALDLFEPLRLAMLVLGVLLGLVIGVIPGIGGIFGLVLLIPMTYTLDPVSAFALLLGMASVTTTSDTIPAVLIGVPGTVGAAATVVDGHELAKQNQAARAFGAAYSASLIGGVFGALVLALSLPIMRPLVLLLNFGDLLAITIFGLALVALVSGRSPAKGLLAALIGALIGYTGLDPQQGIERWTFGQVYLWDGVPDAVLFLGLFGLPELAAVLARGQISGSNTAPEPGGLRRGIGDTLRNWPLVLRSSSIGALLGAIPGIGVVVIEWVAYGDAARSTKGGVPFGQGNIRGVIAPESANNAKEGGSLIPTLAFGIPGSASMAILLGAFMIHGIVPGPEMLEKQTPLLVSLVLTIALANVLGAAICLVASRQLGRLAQVPGTTLVPISVSFVVLGAFQTSYDALDLLTLLAFGVLGLAMKRGGWPRPAFALGFVLAPNLERFFYLTYQISGWHWLIQPVALALLVAAAFIAVRGGIVWKNRDRSIHRASTTDVLVNRFTLALFLSMAITIGGISMTLPSAAGLFPGLVAGVATLIGGAIVVAEVMNRQRIVCETEPSSCRHDGRILLIVALSCLCMLFLGHIAGPIVFIGIIAFAYQRPGISATILTAAAISIVSWIVFDVVSPRPSALPWVAAIWQIVSP